VAFHIKSYALFLYSIVLVLEVIEFFEVTLVPRIAT